MQVSEHSSQVDAPLPSPRVPVAVPPRAWLKRLLAAGSLLVFIALLPLLHVFIRDRLWEKPLELRLRLTWLGFRAIAGEEGARAVVAFNEKLRREGIVERAVKAGDSMPPFELPDTKGRRVRSEELLAKGPLVLSFYRGHW